MKNLKKLANNLINLIFMIIYDFHIFSMFFFSFVRMSFAGERRREKRAGFGRGHRQWNGKWHWPKTNPNRSSHKQCKKSLILKKLHSVMHTKILGGTFLIFLITIFTFISSHVAFSTFCHLWFSFFVILFFILWFLCDAIFRPKW